MRRDYADVPVEPVQGAMKRWSRLVVGGYPAAADRTKRANAVGAAPCADRVAHRSSDASCSLVPMLFVERANCVGRFESFGLGDVVQICERRPAAAAPGRRRMLTVRRQFDDAEVGGDPVDRVP